jgi:N-acylneuraminate cytidylyltransferase
MKPLVLAVIPAKGRSIRVPGKNMKDFNGQPLLHWTLEAARQSSWVTHFAVSSDCPEILSWARDTHHAYAVPRDPELCAHHVTLDPVIFDAVEFMEGYLEGRQYDMVVTLQPTCPIRPRDLIDDCVKALWHDPGANSLVTVHDAGHFAWQLSWADYTWKQVNAHRRPNSQEMEPTDQVYMENGSVVVTRLLKYNGERVLAPVTCYPINPVFGMDIDTEVQFKIAEGIHELMMEGTLNV